MSRDQSQLEKDYENLMMSSWDTPVQSVSHVIEKERKVSMKDTPKTHSRENHDFHMSRFKRCVYCENGIPIKEEEKV